METDHTFFAGGVATQNCQDVDPAHMPLLRECQSSFTEPTTLHTGTSKTLDTLLQKQWNVSSQGVWTTKCTACGYDNKAIHDDGDLVKMIGPYRDDISERRPGTVCASCLLPVSPRLGRWVHRRPERLARHAGYHLPQVIFPFHYAHPDKWKDVLDKRDCRAVGYTLAKFFNECLGEPYEFAIRLLSSTQIRAACREDVVNTLEEAEARGRRYEFVVLGVDWGGGGAEGSSQTRLAAAGLASDGSVEIFYGAAMPFGLDDVDEAKEVHQIAARLGAGYIAHDFNGAGATRESVLTHLGWPIENIGPMVYADIPGAKTCRYVPATGARYRGFYHLGKARSLQFVANCAKRGRVRFFRYDHRGDDDPGLLHDWNNYMENRITSPTGRSVYRVQAVSDTATTDFADAANMACCFLWEVTQSWPNLAGLNI